LPGDPLAGAATSIGSRIGRNFSVVSVLPGLFLTIWTYLLIGSGAIHGSPHLGRLGHLFSSLTYLTWLVLVAFAVGLLLHPLQYPVTQILEGYWGLNPLARVAATTRVLQHRKHQRDLESIAFNAEETWRAGVRKWLESEENTTSQRKPANTQQEQAEEKDALGSEGADSWIGQYLRQQQAIRLGDLYPPDGRRVLPTRLGNTLRRFEETVGKGYGINIIDVAPYLSVVASSEQVSYARGAKEEMDAAVSHCVAALIATAVTIVFLLFDKAWLLLALAPYSAAYFSYRGAVASAEAYGTALAAMLDLGRFDLYESLHIPLPRSLTQEKEQNGRLAPMLGGMQNEMPGYDFPYQHPSESTPPPRNRLPFWHRRGE
jgi:hypothetical protein